MGNTMENRIIVGNGRERLYDVVMEHSFQALGAELKTCGAYGRKACIVTDDNVAPLYLEEVKAVASSLCSHVSCFTFPAGEESKNLDTLKALYQALIQEGYDRHDFLLALGGGVTGDLCGFGAATFLRGISYVQLPTTLLAQVDSSVGGKTGVDVDAYKNMVGAFHMPKLVFANVSTLLTLLPKQFSSGMGEVVKHGLIKDQAYYGWLSRHAKAIQARDLDVLEEMIGASVKIKRDVVEKDPWEEGDRALLNFGHTLGHALEKLSGFKLLHGQCVGLGALGAAYISVSKGSGRGISMDDVAGLEALLKAFQLPVETGGIDPMEVVRVTRNDKKMDSGTIQFILLEKVGKAYVDRSVTDEDMVDGLRHILV